MLSNKMIFFAVIGSFFSFVLTGLSTTLKANDNLHSQTILVAEAHQHGQDKENGHSHDKDKASKHSHQKSEKNEHQHGMMEDKHDYAHMIIFHANELKLTNEQLGRLVRLHLKHEAEHNKIKEKLKERISALLHLGGRKHRKEYQNIVDQISNSKVPLYDFIEMN